MGGVIYSNIVKQRYCIIKADDKITFDYSTTTKEKFYSDVTKITDLSGKHYLKQMVLMAKKSNSDKHMMELLMIPPITYKRLSPYLNQGFVASNTFTPCIGIQNDVCCTGLMLYYWFLANKSVGGLNDNFRIITSSFSKKKSRAFIIESKPDGSLVLYYNDADIPTVALLIPNKPGKKRKAEQTAGQAGGANNDNYIKIGDKYIDINYLSKIQKDNSDRELFSQLLIELYPYYKLYQNDSDCPVWFPIYIQKDVGQLESKLINIRQWLDLFDDVSKFIMEFNSLNNENIITVPSENIVSPAEATVARGLVPLKQSDSPLLGPKVNINNLMPSLKLNSTHTSTDTTSDLPDVNDSEEKEKGGGSAKPRTQKHRKLIQVKRTRSLREPCLIKSKKHRKLRNRKTTR